MERYINLIFYNFNWCFENFHVSPGYRVIINPGNMINLGETKKNPENHNRIAL